VKNVKTLQVKFASNVKKTFATFVVRSCTMEASEDFITVERSAKLVEQLPLFSVFHVKKRIVRDV
jgi:hypothetical protein